MADKKKVTVIGDGGWGTALGLIAFENGHDVTIWGPFADYIETVKACRENKSFLKGVTIPDGVNMTADRAEALKDVDAVILAVPTKYYSDVIASMKGLIPIDASVVSVAKGLDRETHQRMSTLAESLLDHSPVAALSGPSHAEEVARGVPTAVTVACENIDCSEYLQKLLSNNHFRVYTTQDVIGVELGGALKNVIAIAVGISDGLGFGDNTRAALITRGLVEMKRLGVALGADEKTFTGLSGLGDQLNFAACAGPSSLSALLYAESVSSLVSATVHSSILKLSTTQAPAFNTSASEPPDDDITGVPHAIASSGGNPNPS